MKPVSTVLTSPPISLRDLSINFEFDAVNIFRIILTESFHCVRRVCFTRFLRKDRSCRVYSESRRMPDWYVNYVTSWIWARKWLGSMCQCWWLRRCSRTSWDRYRSRCWPPPFTRNGGPHSRLPIWIPNCIAWRGEYLKEFYASLWELTLWCRDVRFVEILLRGWIENF